jgi:hypothetical protein
MRVSASSRDGPTASAVTTRGVPRQFRGAAQHHAAAAGARQHDVAQILVEHQIGDLGGLRLGGDPRPQLMAALGATVQ